VKDLYNENYKTIDKDTGKWKALPCSQLSRINIVKMCILPKVIYTINTVLIKIAMTRAKKKIPKSTWKQKTPTIAKATLSKKSNAGGSLYRFKLFYRAVITKTARC
jgi:hypothetical protein